MQEPENSNPNEQSLANDQLILEPGENSSTVIVKPLN